MAKKKENKKTKRTEKETESTAENFELKLKKHFEEPLFVIAIAAALLAIIKPVFNFALLSVVILLLGVISAYFVYVYFKNNRSNRSLDHQSEPN